MKYKFILLLLIFNFEFLIFTCVAQPTFIDIDENAQNRIMAAVVQNCDFCVEMNMKHITRIENNNQIPAYGLYQNQWDTLYIRSESIDIPFFDNQLKIILIQDNNTPFAFPVSGALSTGYVKNKGKQHTGVDFLVQKDEPIVACFDGVVRVAKKFEEYDNTVVIRHYNGLETLYALLDDVCVITGQKIKAGEVIGHIGTTQYKKSVLHFETRFMNDFFNPEKVINLSERKLQGNMLTLTPNDFIYIPVTTPDLSYKQEEIQSDNNASREQLLNIPKAMPMFHTVATGETIFKICSKYNITEEQLRALNNIKGNHIEVGQKLRIK